MVKVFALVAFVAGLASAQSPPVLDAPQTGFKTRPPDVASGYSVPAGTRILLRMVNTVSTKVAQPGDRIYLETAFPVSQSGRIVIPQGTWVTGTVTEVKRPGRMKGRGELRVRFDSLMLPNGVVRDFRSDVGNVDPRDKAKLNRETGKVEGEGNLGGDVALIGTTAASGAAVGAGVAAIKSGSALAGAGIGAGIGAGVGLAAVLLTRGPDPILASGSSVEMVLDRSVSFDDTDLNFANVAPHTPPAMSNGPDQVQQRRRLPRVPF